jgi:hypothetical protein
MQQLEKRVSRFSSAVVEHAKVQAESCRQLRWV